MRYTRMHGVGNSFVLLENLHGELQGEDLSGLALRTCGLADADGMIVIVPAPGDEDFGMLFYNEDGSVGEMCGNGARCVARYGLEHGLARDPARIRVRTAAGLVTARRIDAERYEVRLNDPSVVDLHRHVPAQGRVFDCAYVELGEPGIPHAVVETPSADFDDLDALRERGRALRRSPSFPRGANVSFVCMTGERRVRAITFERGVEDFTLACGTGCGAIAVTLTLRGRLPEGPVTIDMPGGELSVRLSREGRRVHDVLLTGPTAVTGEYDDSFLVSGF